MRPLAAAGGFAGEGGVASCICCGVCAANWSRTHCQPPQGEDQSAAAASTRLPLLKKRP
jgi:hypothetical protein